MAITELDLEIRALRARINRIADEVKLDERLRLDDVAQSFIEASHEIRAGDFVRFSDGHAARIFSINSDGKWHYLDRHGHSVEPFRVPPEEGIERLYTISEVAAIIAKVSL